MVDGTHFLQILHLTHHQVVLVLLVEAHGDCAGTSPIVKETLAMNNCQVYQRELEMVIIQRDWNTLYKHKKGQNNRWTSSSGTRGKGTMRLQPLQILSCTASKLSLQAFSKDG